MTAGERRFFLGFSFYLSESGRICVLFLGSLLIPKGLHRIGEGRLNRMVSDSQEGNDK